MNSIELMARRHLFCIILWAANVLLLQALCVSAEVRVPETKQKSYPKIMSMNIGNPTNYEDEQYRSAMSRADVLILNFWPQWKEYKFGVNGMRQVVQDLKQKNPNILIGQYTVLSETQLVEKPNEVNYDKSAKLVREGWWLRNAKGDQVQWTQKYKAWDINITSWAKPDKNGVRYPQWLARRDYAVYFSLVPDFDIWYFDNAVSRPPVKLADWNGDGIDDAKDTPSIAAAFRRGHVSHWEEAKRLYSKGLFVGNSDDVSSPEYSGKLQGVFMEAAIGASWSTERLQGWDALMTRYRSAMEHTTTPHLVGFNVHGKKDDYKRMRYGLASCLLDDGYFSYTDDQVGYSSVPWFDEYDIKLGKPVDPPATQPWENGIYRRNFEEGTVLVNPGLLPRTVTLEPGFRRIKGSQAPGINNGTVVSSLTLGGKDGIILIRNDN